MNENTLEFIITIIASLLSSTVLVGIIEFFKWNKDNKIANITTERKNWRDDLRTIAVNIYSSQLKFDLNKFLVELKVRINSNGMFTKLDSYSDSKSLQGKIDSFKNDEYLWVIINKIEDLPIEEAREFLPLLTKGISLLVKHDWDRSKNEIISNNHKKYDYILFSITILTCAFLLFLNLFENLQPIEYLSFIVSLFMFCLLPYLIPYLLCIHINKTESPTLIKISYNTIPFLLLVGLDFILLMITGYLRALILSNLPLAFFLFTLSFINLFHNQFNVNAQLEILTYQELANDIIMEAKKLPKKVQLELSHPPKHYKFKKK